jgi:hypothetical protein
MNNKTKTMILLTALASLVLLGAPACVAQSEGGDGTAPAAASTADLTISPYYATCSSDCSATHGAPITKTNCSTCSANSAEVVCNGVTYACAPPQCVQPPKPKGGCTTNWYWCGCPDPSDPFPTGWKCGVCE